MVRAYGAIGGDLGAMERAAAIKVMAVFDDDMRWASMFAAIGTLISNRPGSDLKPPIDDAIFGIDILGIGERF